MQPMLGTLLLAVGAGGALAPEGRTAESERVENVVVIVMDEVGLDQLACYDDQNGYAEPYPYAHTPRIDRLAREGARFTQCRAAPVCSPSRAMLLTGRYPFRTGIGGTVWLRNATPLGLELGNPRAEIGLPAILQGRRGAVGKWHLGLEPDEGGTMPAHPLSIGFSEWRGTTRNIGGDCTSPPGAPAGYRNYWWWEGGVRAHVQGEFLTIRTRERAADWLLSGSGPRFLYLAFNACHEPLSIPPADQHGFGPAIPDRHVNTLARANLECLDRQLELFLDALPPRTCVFLMGDNGTQVGAMRAAPGEVRYPVGHPLHEPGDESRPLSLAPYEPQRAKRGLFEGGVRVPLIVWGPPVVPGRRDDLVDAVDLFKTIAELVQAPVPSAAAQDSQSFLGALCGVPGTRTFSFTQVFEPNGAAPAQRTRDESAYVRRDGAHLWKLIQKAGETDQFYDVAADPLERRDLGEEHPERRATLAGLRALLASESR